ncbi:MAG: nickel-dependent lactate racemase [Planctomycetota bacterium]|nr:nickel-dependent lactate racemase [Planctomycetota bacterium]
MKTKTVKLLYGRSGMVLRVPADAVVLEGKDIQAIADPTAAVAEAMANPIGSPALSELISNKQPRTVTITISDITRPVPNKVFLPSMLDALNAAGVADSQITIVIGTGMHRPSTPEEREILLGEIQSRVEVTDHTADKPDTLVKVSDDPPVSVNRRFAEADFRIVTGFIESHFMAGFSGGRKGVCPALVDLETIERFHGYDALSDRRADAGVLEGNPCHEIALKIARTVGVDFLFNVAITRDRRIAGIYCGDLEAAHQAGCKDVAEWTSAEIKGPFDLVITNGGGYALDTTFYQAVKGMCGAMPALGPDSTLLIASACSEGLGSKPFAELILSYGGDWRRFLSDIAAAETVRLDQWEFQMRARVLERIGLERLWFVSDGIEQEIQKRIGVTSILGDGDAQLRAQRAIDEFVSANPAARIAVLPDGPYTLLRRNS